MRTAIDPFEVDTLLLLSDETIGRYKYVEDYDCAPIEPDLGYAGGYWYLLAIESEGIIKYYDSTLVVPVDEYKSAEEI